MSELVLESNGDGDGRVAMSRMFHRAVAASYRPARRPTRGSGLGRLVACADTPLASTRPMLRRRRRATAMRAPLAQGRLRPVIAMSFAEVVGGSCLLRYVAGTPRITSASISCIRVISVV